MKKGTSIQKRAPNASIAAQRAWALLTPTQKAILKKRYRQDPDHDGVPTGFDCRPYNPKKQEAFLPEDATYAKTHTVIPLQRKGDKERLLGEGTNGYVLGVADSNRVVVKVGKSDAWNSLKAEADFYKKHNMSKLPLMIPLKEVKTDTGENAVLKPVVKPVVEPGNHVTDKSIFTDQKLAELRSKIIKLSYMGFVFTDGLQLGIDKAGRLLQFDTGAMKKLSSKPSFVFRENNREWLDLLKKLGKSASKYGKIERVPSLELKKQSSKSSKNTKTNAKSTKINNTSVKTAKIYIDPKFHFHVKHEEIYKKVKEVLKQFPEIKEVTLSTFYPTNKLDKNTVAWVNRDFETPFLAFNMHMMPTYDTIYHELWHFVQQGRKSTLTKTNKLIEAEATLFGMARMKPEHVENNFMCYFNTVPKSKVIHYGKMALAEKEKGNKHYVSDTFKQAEADKDKEIKAKKSNAKRWQPILKKDLPVNKKYNVVKNRKNYAAGYTPSIVNKKLRTNIRKSQQNEKNLFKAADKNTEYVYTKSNLIKVPTWMKSSKPKSKKSISKK